MARPKRHICDKLSNWEVAELYLAWRRGTPKRELCGLYDVSKTTVDKSIRRFEAAGRGERW